MFRARGLGNLKALALRRCLSMLKDNVFSRHVTFRATHVISSPDPSRERSVFGLTGGSRSAWL